MTEVWHGLVNTLRQLPPVDPGTRIITDDDTPIRPIPAIESEKKTLDRALEQLEMLIALRRNEEQAIELARHTAAVPSHPVPIVTVQGSTPSGSGPPGSHHKRKRRTSLSYSASPAPTPIPNSAESALTSIASPLPGRGSTPGSREMVGKQRKEAFMDQLPLQPGRKIAFRQPSDKARGKSAPDEDEEVNWILATIQKCLGMDKMRYAVVDPDDGS
jgi:SAGA-associated factor 29